MIAINKHSSKLKNMSVEMPNAPYSNRWDQMVNDEK
jgi:tetrahydromethanopterin S-methyltransferase subunit F